MSREFAGFERSDGRVGVRNTLLVLPSVGCSNSTIELVGERVPEAAIVTHQHGCAQIGDDLALTAATLAAVGSHPNVAASLVVGLGCESNQPVALSERIHGLGGRAEVVGIQESGGVEAAASDAVEVLHRMAAEPAPTRVQAPVASLRVALLADRPSGELGRGLVEAIASALRSAGCGVVTAEDLPAGALTATGFPEGGVPASWRGDGRKRALPLPLLVEPTRAPTSVVVGDHDVERLTGLSALGAQVGIVVTGRGSPIGSPIVPTLKIGTEPGWAFLNDLFDVPLATPDDAEDIVRMVLEVASGMETAAERLGQRDFAMWRVGPTL